ncbi:MAG: hypothetical protein IJS60_05615 [Abditibacteriota bacterium]|nr:hypothetical protein [Abditibacteriota bacterium]
MDLVILAVLGILFLVAACFYIRRVLYLVIDGDITTIQSFIYVGAFLVLMMLFFYIPFNGFRFVIVLFVVIFDLFIDKIMALLNKQEDKEHYMRKVMEYDKQLLENPYNWVALSEKAYCYFKMKDYEKAISIQDKVVRMSQNDINEINKLKTYKKFLEKIESTDVKCWYCGVMVPKGIEKCYNCGHSMNFGENFINWLKHGGLKDIIVNTAVIILIFVLYKFVLSFLSENLRFIIHILTCILIFAGVAFIIFKKD